MAEQTEEPHAEESEQTSTHAWGQPRVLPLNSSRLILQWLKAIAGGLRLPGNATQAELRQLVDGCLPDQEREPMNIQVLLFPVEGEVRMIRLSDAYGCFLEVPVEVQGTLRVSREAHMLSLPMPKKP